MLDATAEGPVLPFASDWGGSYSCYPLRPGESARELPVLYWNHEYAEEPEEEPLLWSELAADFPAFVRWAVT